MALINEIPNSWIVATIKNRSSAQSDQLISFTRRSISFRILTALTSDIASPDNIALFSLLGGHVERSAQPVRYKMREKKKEKKEAK
eukprot:scaffold17184_cov27-Prasinocladus_malaysianus.AAC.1